MANNKAERQRVRQVIAQTSVAMFVTLDDHGDHQGRPMLPLLVDNDPHIYLLTRQSSRKVTHVEARPQVGLMISAADSYFSIVGRADISRDAQLIGRLWHPSYRAWFPGGRDDREVTVLRVSVDRIDYWEPPRSRFVRVFQAARAVLTGRAVETPMKSLDGLT